MKNKDYITMTLEMKIEGKVRNKKEVKIYSRGTERSVFTLDELVRSVLIWENMYFSHSTYIDDLIGKYKDVLPSEHTPEELFQMYWINLKETIEKEFEKYNKGVKNSIFPQQNDYLKHCIYSMLDEFYNSPAPVRYGFFYYLFYKVLNGSLEEFKMELSNIPENIKEIVDSIVQKKEENNEQ